MERFEAQEVFYTLENTLIAVLMKQKEDVLVKSLVKKDLQTLKETWTVISNISLPLPTLAKVKEEENSKEQEESLSSPPPSPVNVKGALIPLLMTYLHQLYLYYKSLLCERVKKLGSRKLKDLLQSDNPEIAELMSELASFVSQFKPSDHKTILYNVKMMDLAEDMHEEINDTV